MAAGGAGNQQGMRGGSLGNTAGVMGGGKSGLGGVGGHIKMPLTQAGYAAQQLAKQRLGVPRTGAPAAPAMTPLQQLISSFVPRYQPGATVSKYPGV